MIVTVTDTATGPLPPVAVPIMESLAQHRLLTTLQIHELHTPDKTTHWTRHVLRRLHAAELVDAARLPGGLGLWFLTEQGTEAIELIPSRPERRRKQITHAQATGPLRHHTLAVNEVGLALVRAARARGDECGPLAWRHEIAHPIGPAPGRRTPEQLIADALLTYQRNQPDGTTTFHYRFIELDRATMPVDDLAAKLARYATLYHHTLPPTGPTDRPRPLWTHSYAIFPGVLLVLTGRDRPALERRRSNAIALCRTNPQLTATPAVKIAACLLADLIDRGPFAPILKTTHDPARAVGWLDR
ncbi:replication-relaxation family protein [Conexibacter arvalis]|uniref:Replication-relaxation n=1 Tax=Conexibacter arvalis TaxID=912552 RepID=A0A840IAZ8_9ACTN|nr:hypothetical protein [Conexibacter arvalis]